MRHQSLEREVLPELYLSGLQSDVTEFAIVARADDPPSLVRAVHAELAALAEPVLIRRVVPFQTLVAHSTAERERRAVLLSLLGGLGPLQACVGIFGLTGYAVARRTPEIGIRMALGASPARVLGTVMGSFVVAICAGLVLGLCGAWAASRVIAQYLFQVTPTDPVTLIAVCVILTAVALVACYLPARRALRVDPVVALRTE